MNRIFVTMVLTALALGTLTVAANAAAGGFCRSMGQDAPACQR